MLSVRLPESRAGRTLTPEQQDSELKRLLGNLRFALEQAELIADAKGMTSPEYAAAQQTIDGLLQRINGLLGDL